MTLGNQAQKFSNSAGQGQDRELAHIIDSWTKGTDGCDTPIANLCLFRREWPSSPAVCMVEPSIVVVVQGAKQMVIGGETYSYDTSHFLITSLDLPANSAVTMASPEEPCLGLSLKLDLSVLAELLAQGGPPPLGGLGVIRSTGIGSITPAIRGPIGRLLELLKEPAAIPTLSPLILREIHYRLLISDQAALLRQIASVDGHGHRIAKAIDWLKSNYAMPLRIEELAALVQMSPPTFHRHFRQLTAMSPLQYQKWLRLNEAKRLMLTAHLDAASAAFQVGYESPSQFSREYGRLFGAPPKRDIEALRRRAIGGALGE